MLTLSSALHQLAALIWVGGMFFAYVLLRPVLAERDGAERLAVWHGVFRRFFVWVAGAIVVLFATGYLLIFQGFGGFGGAGVHIHVMHLLGLVMALLFVWLIHGPWKRFRLARAASDPAAAATALGGIRRIVAANLALGLVTAAIGASGSWWGH
jgi:uncharacterized membrane protein